MDIGEVWFSLRYKTRSYATAESTARPILVPFESSYTTFYSYSYLVPFPTYGWLLVKFSLATVAWDDFYLFLNYDDDNDDDDGGGEVE